MSDIDVATDMGQNQGEAQPVIQEKMLPQSEVDRLVGAVRAKERASIEAQYRQSGGMGGVQQPEAIDKQSLIEEARKAMQEQWDARERELEEQTQRAQIDKLAADYLEKMKQGPTLYEDFKEVTKSFNPGKYPQLTLLASRMENTPDIIYDLKKNPQKLAMLHVLAMTDPEEAEIEMTKLSKSIKRNEDALANNMKSPTPLSKLKSSARAGQDTGKRTVSDLRRDPRFRG